MNLQIAVENALGLSCESGIWIQRLSDTEDFVPTNQNPPDPSDPRVYEAVVKLAVEKDSMGFTEALAEIVEDEMVREHAGLLDIACAKSEQRLRAALRVLE